MVELESVIPKTNIRHDIVNGINNVIQEMIPGEKKHVNRPKTQKLQTQKAGRKATTAFTTSHEVHLNNPKRIGLRDLVRPRPSRVREKAKRFQIALYYSQAP
ncbi:hypothetical protein EVAR_78997_1 [Eumeta japonica]|uniref:Uncharacterized protein n=1 Tax=Eumeta variegata TaxID=151549 RepID=A0A4C1US59_EUMVA|nr:hypothetical protein EVAR_78997_1 [Eumeta japonica]